MGQYQVLKKSYNFENIPYNYSVKNRWLICDKPNHLRTKRPGKKQRPIFLFYKLPSRPKMYTTKNITNFKVLIINYDENFDRMNFLKFKEENYNIANLPFTFESEILDQIVDHNYLSVNDYQLLRYSSNCFSSKSESCLSDYICLYFPSGMVFEGGMIKLFKNDSELLTEFNASNLRNDTFLIFSSSIQYEVTKVTSGIQYIVKINIIQGGEIKLPRNPSFINTLKYQ